MSNYGVAKICEAAHALLDQRNLREGLAFVWEEKLFAVASEDVTESAWAEIRELRRDLSSHEGTKHFTPVQISARYMSNSKLRHHRHRILEWAIDMGGKLP